MKYPISKPPRRPGLGAALGLAILAAPGLGHATVMVDINFSEPGSPIVSDPTIEGYSFFAGDPANFTDTYTDDAQTPGNPYLVSGTEDDPNNYVSPQSTSFIGATGGTVGGLNLTTVITLDAAFFTTLPSGSTLRFEALSGGIGGAVVGSTTLSDNSSTPVYHTLSITLTNFGFDALRLYGTVDFGQPFRIDNLRVDTANNTNPVPVPSTLFLAGAGLLALARRRA